MAQYDDYNSDYNDQEQAERIDSYYNNEDAEYQRQQRFCAACHDREKDYSESSQSILCYECRQQYMKLRVPLKIKLFLAAICAVFVLSVAIFPSVISSYKLYVDADRNIEAREFTFAYNNYCLVLEKYNGSVPIILKAADAAMSAQYFGDLAQILDTYLAGKEVNDSEYDQAMRYSDFLDAYYDTMQEVVDISTEIDSTFSENESTEAIQAFQDGLEALLSKSGVDKTLVYFYLGNASQDAETALSYLKLATEQDARLTYPYSYYGNALRRAGRLDEARQVYQTALNLNACDALSMRGLSILQLLEGDKILSLYTMQQAYEIEPYGLYIAESLIIALCENDMRDDAMSLLEQLVSEGFEVEDDLQEYLDGNIGVDQYYFS